MIRKVGIQHLFATYAVALCGLLTLPAGAAESAADCSQLAGDWSRHNPDSTAFINYRPWLGFMEHFSAPEGAEEIDYLRLHHRGTGFLEIYVNRLSEVKVSELNRDQQLAFWLNLYNAQAVRLTGLAYPLETSQALVEGKDAVWARKTLKIEGVDLSLRDIRQCIVLQQWPDPRVIYGLFLPGKSGPGLPARPFEGHRVWAQLEALAEAYINDRQHVAVKDQTLQLASLYSWHADLFADDDGSGLIEHLRAFAEPDLQSALDKVSLPPRYGFNWSLDDYDSGFDPANQKQFGS